jgi:hypothetical protein
MHTYISQVPIKDSTDGYRINFMHIKLATRNTQSNPVINYIGICDTSSITSDVLW